MKDIRREARDSGKSGMTLSRFVLDFNLARNFQESNSLIRSGSVELNDSRIKDTLYHVTPGNYSVKIEGKFILEATLL